MAKDPKFEVPQELRHLAEEMSKGRVNSISSSWTGLGKPWPLGRQLHRM
jgi:hypothetical protein